MTINIFNAEFRLSNNEEVKVNIIKYSNVSLKYDGREILKNFSLEVKVGEKVLISGKSGKGKSTLLRLLLGFASADDGEIYVENQPISTSNIYDIRKNFAYVNQDVTLRPGKVSDVLKEVSKFSGNDYDGQLDEELCKYFEFDQHLLDKPTEELSGGERQRLGIMLAIMLKKPIYLLDEVTSALDENLKYKVVEYFKTSKSTVISISHDAAWHACDVFRKVVW